MQTGSPESLSPLPQVQSVRVTGPNDQVAEFRTSSGPITYAATDVPGLYRVQQIVQQHTLAFGEIADRHTWPR